MAEYSIFPLPCSPRVQIQPGMGQKRGLGTGKGHPGKYRELASRDNADPVRRDALGSEVPFPSRDAVKSTARRACRLRGGPPRLIWDRFLTITHADAPYRGGGCVKTSRVTVGIVGHRNTASCGSTVPAR